MTALFILVLLFAGQPLQDSAKLIGAIVAGALVVLGGLFALAWTVSQKGRTEWFKLADELMESDGFREAVTRAREPAARSIILEIYNEVDRRIKAHNDDQDAQRPAVRHGMNNISMTIGFDLAAMRKDIQALSERVKALEERRSRERKPQ